MTTILSRIPTDIYFDRLFQNSINYWWLRSPHTNSLYDFFAWAINPSGFVSHDHNYVYNSYGSPVTTISDFTQIVYPNGILNNGSYGVDNSYGSPHTGGVVSASMIYPSGIADEIGVGDMRYSYGIKCIIALRALIGAI